VGGEAVAGGRVRRRQATAAHATAAPPMAGTACAERVGTGGNGGVVGRVSPAARQHRIGGGVEWGWQAVGDASAETAKPHQNHHPCCDIDSAASIL